jgi:hypothetical protein
MSRTGISPCAPPDVLKNLAVICSFVCYCNEHPCSSRSGDFPPPRSDAPDTDEKTPEYR